VNNILDIRMDLANDGPSCDYCARDAEWSTELGLMCGQCHGWLLIARKIGRQSTPFHVG
jgi:hypothetical protein